jgi:hypothetical protein
VEQTRNRPAISLAPTTINIVLRTSLPLAALSTTVIAAVRELDPSIPVARLRDMDSVFTESISRPRLLARLVVAFAGLALLLAAVGADGVLSYIVAGRRREIGIRMALGADRGAVLAQIMKQGLAVAALGVAADRRHDVHRRHRDDSAGGGSRLLAARLARLTPRSERCPQRGMSR